jgi:mRNA-degrading endonuclease RelE of RelBE toxin-antitoxin system
LDWSELEVKWTASGEREAGRLDPPILRRVAAAVDRFAETGHGNVQHLTGIKPSQHRLRVGDWRVRLIIDKREKVLYVMGVLPRGKAYR